MSAGSLPPLADADEEASRVDAYFSSPKLLRGREATIAAVEGDLPGSEVFHFAGHAIMRGPNRGLVLAISESGQPYSTLSGSRVQGLKLRRSQLVVLSACSTGIQRQSGQIDPNSLVRSFLIAGAPRIVAARWDIDSRVTGEFMNDFYRELSSGATVAKAIHNAEQEIRRMPRRGHPYFWAGFGSVITNSE